ncbi:MAG: DUF2971 domain-containing protein, partial [Romboutsia sp.]|nr:DUF2971 domain-containing protein [Romboutsia sp.]
NSCSYSDNCIKVQEENNKKIKSIKDNMIWISTYNNLNDPFELNAIYIDEEKLKKYGWPISEVRTIFEKLKKSFLIGSFTIHLEDCLPMWAHYANNHEGICVEYSVEDPSYLYKVSYENNRIAIASIIANLINEVYSEEKNKKSNIDRYLSCIINSACIKDRSWKYEDEFRILYQNLKSKEEVSGLLVNENDIGLKLSGVFLGINCNSEYEKELKSICRLKKCDIYKMCIENNKEKFSLTKRLI